MDLRVKKTGKGFQQQDRSKFGKHAARKKLSSIGPGCFEKFVALSQLTICAQVVFESVESGCKTEDLTEKLLVVCQT